MKWAAGIVVAACFLLGLERGWNDPFLDVIFYPAFGFIAGLLVVWMARLTLRHFHKQYDDRGVGPTLFWISTAVALYYVALAIYGIYLHYEIGIISWLIASALFCWAIGWAARHNISGRIST